jgi:phage gpG-like protein
MLTLKMDVGGVTRSLQLLADNLTPVKLRAPLREISKDKQAEVRQRFEQGGPGWAPRAPATQTRAIRTLDKLQRAAQGRSGAVLEGDLRKQLGRAISRGAKASTIDRRRLEIALLRELRGADTSSLEPAIRAAYGSASRKQREQSAGRLFQRALKAHGKALKNDRRLSGRPLGQLANSIQAKIEGVTLTVKSSVKWSKVQNEGGRVGNGAVLPARPFLEWTAADLEKAVATFERHMIKAIVGE